MGVDSAVTISFGLGKTNIYEDAEKLFQLGENQIGIATVGMVGFGDRGVAFILRCLKSKDIDGSMTQGRTLAQISESLAAVLFYDTYAAVVIPAAEAAQKTPRVR